MTQIQDFLEREKKDQAAGSEYTQVDTKRPQANLRKRVEKTLGGN
ncbi:protein of unknown function [Georgfuchsia toluolica]|uniref:Uncharacterized protein n=1 Tax=Georgfuchsia toluolica TaxID=424218 RepID=A0A916NIG7_9PROT|nr:protein of unknown function [Georgfuchsia toluolica]